MESFRGKRSLASGKQSVCGYHRGRDEIVMEVALKNNKVYVAVTARFNSAGLLLPQSITWEDGSEYIIDQVLDVRQASAQKAGGQGDRYTIRIGSHLTYLFFERSCTLSGQTLGKWFVERGR